MVTHKQCIVSTPPDIGLFSLGHVLHFVTPTKGHLPQKDINLWPSGHTQILHPCSLVSVTSYIEGGNGYFHDSWSALFFPVKCEMGVFFLLNRDFHSSREG